MRTDPALDAGKCINSHASDNLSEYTVRCHNCNSYCCSTRPVPSHDSYLRDSCQVAMIRTYNAIWAGDYYPVVHHRCDLMDPYCGAPGSSSDLSDPTTGTVRSPPSNTTYSSTHTVLLYWVTHVLTTTITCAFHENVVDSTGARARLTRQAYAASACRVLPPLLALLLPYRRATPLGRFRALNVARALSSLPTT